MPAAKLKAALVSEIVWAILWTKEMRARRGDEAIELTATEFALLAAMAASPGASSPGRSCSTRSDGLRGGADLGQHRCDRLRAIGEVEVDQVYADSHECACLRVSAARRLGGRRDRR